MANTSLEDRIDALLAGIPARVILGDAKLDPDAAGALNVEELAKKSLPKSLVKDVFKVELGDEEGDIALVISRSHMTKDELKDIAKNKHLDSIEVLKGGYIGIVLDASSLVKSGGK